MIRAEIRHRMTRRLAGWDYSQRAIYMITVTLADRSREWLGTLAKNGEAQNSPVPGHSCHGLWRIAPTPYGEAAMTASDGYPLEITEPHSGLCFKFTAPSEPTEE